MAVKHLAALAATIAICAPAAASDLGETGPSTTFYVAIPLDARSVKDSLSFGLAFQGRRSYETVRLDSRMFERFRFSPLAGIEAKWLVAGGVAVAAAIVVGKKDKDQEQYYQQQQEQQRQQEEQQQQSSGGGSTGGGCPKLAAC